VDIYQNQCKTLLLAIESMTNRATYWHWLISTLLSSQGTDAHWVPGFLLFFRADRQT